MLKLAPQRYINLFKVETNSSIMVYAVCIEVNAPGEYTISEPRLVKVTQKRQLALPGAVVSPFTLAGVVAKQTITKRVISPFSRQFTYKTADYLKWYKANAPNF